MAESPKTVNVRVKMLATVGPTPTDKATYHAGSEWTMPAPRAEELEASGDVEILEILDDAPSPSSPDEDEE